VAPQHGVSGAGTCARVGCCRDHPLGEVAEITMSNAHGEAPAVHGTPGLLLDARPPCSWAHLLSRLPEGGPKKLRSNIRRSTETGIAVEMRTRVTRQGSRESTDGSTNSNSSDGT